VYDLAVVIGALIATSPRVTAWIVRGRPRDYVSVEIDGKQVLFDVRVWPTHPLNLAEQIINRLLARYGPELIIVHGGAPGVENGFAMACRELGIVAEPHLADWKGLGNIAGPERNREMVEASGAPIDL
jgi:hypothetical protein